MVLGIEPMSARCKASTLYTLIQVLKVIKTLNSSKMTVGWQLLKKTKMKKAWMTDSLNLRKIDANIKERCLIRKISTQVREAGTIAQKRKLKTVSILGEKTEGKKRQQKEM